MARYTEISVNMPFNDVFTTNISANHACNVSECSIILAHGVRVSWSQLWPVTNWIIVSLVLPSHIFDHPRSSVRRQFRLRMSVCICIYVCLSVCNTITFDSLWRKKFIFTHPVYLEGIRVKSVYEGHRVKVKVSGAKKSKIPIPAM